MTSAPAWIFPALTAAFGLSAFISGYAIAVARNDESPWFSYISDGGAYPPESCVFGWLLNMSALFWIITACALHERHMTRIDVVENPWRRKVSITLFGTAWFTAFGLTIVANFQEHALGGIHFYGAMLAFTSGLAYCWGQTLFSYAARERRTTTLWMSHVRAILSFTCTASFVLHLVAAVGQVFVNRVANGVMPTEPAFSRVARYEPSSPFYTNHLIACVAEWVLAICFEVFILTFSWELSDLPLHAPKLIFLDKEPQLPRVAKIEIPL